MFEGAWIALLHHLRWLDGTRYREVSANVCSEQGWGLLGCTEKSISALQTLGMSRAARRECACGNGFEIDRRIAEARGECFRGVVSCAKQRQWCTRASWSPSSSRGLHRKLGVLRMVLSIIVLDLGWK